MDGFKVINKLGEGAYSLVFKVRRYEDDKIYALKKVKLLKLSKKEKENALNEVRILASVKSNFVISYKEAFFEEKESCLGIVMEFADRGDLYQKITEYRKKQMLFSESDIWRIFIQLVKGLKALHDLKILHRDLKSANVFLFSDGSAKLGDLNVSKVAKKGLGYTQTGTPYYASPEVWDDRPYNLKSDIWSLGIVLYEMIMLKPPFRAENMEGLYNKVIKGIYPKINEKYSSDLNDVLKLLIQVEPSKRPTCEQILELPVIQKRIEYFKAFSGEDVSEDLALLQTINIPKNLIFLSEKLPQPNYDTTLNKRNFNPFSIQKNLMKPNKTTDNKIPTISKFTGGAGGTSSTANNLLPSICLKGSEKSLMKNGSYNNIHRGLGLVKLDNSKVGNLNNNNLNANVIKMGNSANAKSEEEHNHEASNSNILNNIDNNLNNISSIKKVNDDANFTGNANNSEILESPLKNINNNHNDSINNIINEDSAIIANHLSKKKDSISSIKEKLYNPIKDFQLEKGDKLPCAINPNNPNNNNSSVVISKFKNFYNLLDSRDSVSNSNLLNINQSKMSIINSNEINDCSMKVNSNIKLIMPPKIIQRGDSAKRRILLPDIRGSSEVHHNLSKLKMPKRNHKSIDSYNLYKNYKNINNIGVSSKQKLIDIYKLYAPSPQKKIGGKYAKYHVNKNNIGMGLINSNSNLNNYYLKSIENQANYCKIYKQNKLGNLYRQNSESKNQPSQSLDNTGAKLYNLFSGY